ncbi:MULTISPECIES: FAD-binding and (Fe-S)-binding domain-containing protein [unclassified Haloferax]|uniref:FAD-binding and (Fe-S)-binding domain-containing protein n=1 Tax=unclassified Haloferax TaxID=2625095 RepID=UPI0002AF68CD|nr:MULTISPECIES: FAD-binding oxidoreductase [unclassified Haloferax]ELZ54945.1 FAD-linked oxidase domain-containing protein [Haloferax sp. ATCC BAA-646]ELZ66332.1 FAD-linked oxidase domain-containing protein [Haloferax sp. ATCC BAA-644]ELZ66625.1 FAD-linked oxidase domain-containing protein [Haloferax sp. ATCC BAA-645]
MSGDGPSRATRITAETDGERRGDFRRFQESRDYDVADVAEHADLAADLREAVSGEVRFDEYAQVLYATDGSIYRARPAGVVVPRNEDDVRAAVRTAAEHDVPVLPRGAGSSLAGQTVGPGCVVVDCSKYMDEIVRVDPDARRARVQPGVVQDDLDDRLADHGLKFAPDPASSNRSTVGGGIGNNSTGAHSVRYGITDAYTEELRVVLADGSVVHTRDVVVGSDEWDRIVGKDDREAALYRTVLGLVEDHEEEIERRYPNLKRSVSGYNLHKVVSETDDGETVVNLSKLFVGAEGTLGVVVEATVSLVTVPEETALVLYAYDDLVEAMAAVPDALDFDASAVELMDDEVLRMAAESSEYAQYVEEIPDGTAATLMLEFDSELHDDFEAVIREANDHFLRDGDAGSAAGDVPAAGDDADDTDTDTDDGGAFEAIEAYTPAAQADLWKLRKAAIPLLMSLPGDPKPYPFIEDASVPPEELAEYVQSFEDVLEAHGTSAAYFAHAGAGTLHIRPILNLKDGAGIETMRAITDDVTDLVLDHRGAFSGEHGDGMARTEWNPKMYGPELWGAFKELKTAFDPDWRMNPGNVVYRDGPDDLGPDGDRGVGADMREHLRYGAAYQSIEPATTLDFSDEGGFSHLVELCNGCGTCRQTGSETMCPTYRASKDEAETTRGRANMLRAAISGELPEDEIHSDRFQEEVLGLCVGCKGCQNDCPTGVDLAKLKAEVKHAHHAEEGASLRERLFANIDRLAGVGSALAPVSNWAAELPGARAAMERLAGVAPDRSLPSFTRDTLESWMDGRRPRVPASEADHRVLLFPDTYTNYVTPEIGKAAVRVLEAAGVHVRLAEGVEPSGRAAYSGGFLDLARRRAGHNVETLRPSVENGWSVVFVEPSDAVMFQDEYADLLPDDAVAPVAAAASGVMEFLDTHRLDESLPVRGRSADGDAAGTVASAVADGGTLGSLTYHGHCNQKALNKDHHAVGVLRRVGYEVDPLDSSCCGMAGSFGYEAEHYDLSKAMGDILFKQVDDSRGDEVVAPGASCRTQLEDRDDAARRPPHPIEKVAQALSG